MEGRRRRARPHAHLRMVASRLPPSRLRHVHLHRQGRQVREGGGRPRPPHKPGTPVPALFGDGRVPPASRPHKISHEARPRGPRQGRLGAHNLGRGARHPRARGEEDLGDLRTGGDLPLEGHRPRGDRVRAAHGPGRVQDAEQRVHDVGRLLLRTAHGDRRLPAWGGLPRARLRRLLPRPLRRPALRGAEVHRAVGQEPAAIQPRRVLRARYRGPHETGLEAHRDRPAPDVARLARGVPPAAAPGNRCRHRPRDAERDHRGGPL